MKIKRFEKIDEKVKSVATKADINILINKSKELCNQFNKASQEITKQNNQLDWSDIVITYTSQGGIEQYLIPNKIDFRRTFNNEELREQVSLGNNTYAVGIDQIDNIRSLKEISNDPIEFLKLYDFFMKRDYYNFYTKIFDKPEYKTILDSAKYNL